MELTNPDKVFVDGHAAAPDKELLLTLALDLAFQTDTPAAIAENLGLTPRQMHGIITGNEYFQAVYRSLKAQAKAVNPDNIVQKQAEVFAAELMPHMSRLAKDPGTPETVAAQLFKTFMASAGLGGNKGANAAGSSVAVNINFSPDPRLTRVPKPKVINS